MAFTDSFTYSGTPSANEPLSARSGWTLLSGTALDVYVQSSGTTCGVSPTAESAYICTDQGTADHYTQVVMKGSCPSFICIRLVDANNYIGFRHNAGLWQVFKRVAGTLTQLGTSYTASLSGSNVAKLSAEGTTITFTVDGVERCGSPFTVSDHSTETSQGLNGRSSGTASWIDDFTAGAASAGAIVTQPTVGPTQSILTKGLVS